MKAHGSAAKHSRMKAMSSVLKDEHQEAKIIYSAECAYAICISSAGQNN